MHPPTLSRQNPPPCSTDFLQTRQRASGGSDGRLVNMALASWDGCRRTDFENLLRQHHATELVKRKRGVFEPEAPLLFSYAQDETADPTDAEKLGMPPGHLDDCFRFGANFESVHQSAKHWRVYTAKLDVKRVSGGLHQLGKVRAAGGETPPRAAAIRSQCSAQMYADAFPHMVQEWVNFVPLVLLPGAPTQVTFPPHPGHSCFVSGVNQARSPFGFTVWIVWHPAQAIMAVFSEGIALACSAVRRTARAPVDGPAVALNSPTFMVSAVASTAGIFLAILIVFSFSVVSFGGLMSSIGIGCLSVQMAATHSAGMVVQNSG